MRRFLTTEEFIRKAKKIHGNTYNYSITCYISAKTVVKIICNKHGTFSQAPFNHLRGYGCPKCGKDRINLNSILKYGFNPVSYESYSNKLSKIGVICYKNKTDERVLDVECHYCNKIFTPDNKSIKNKIRSSMDVGKGESNLYCSNKCKEACPTFNHRNDHIDPRSIVAIDKNDAYKVRNCQTDTLKQLQCDTHGYNYCEKCGDIIDVELHHTLNVSKYGSNAINSAGHILLCAGCHTDLHNKCDVTY